MSISIREVEFRDLSVVAEMMHEALEPFYGGDHRAHARRIVETSSQGRKDTKGHFSAAQIMFVAEKNGHIVGLLNFVVKYQGTLKISPLIVRESERGKGVGRLLFAKVLEHALKNDVRQIYCTVSAKNRLALEYFLTQGFVQAGRARLHYRVDLDEIMLYKIVEHHDIQFKESVFSVIPMSDEDSAQVRSMILSRLPEHFEGVDESWVDALFAGYARRNSGDPNEKYKLIWVAKSTNGKILGVAAATPKKGKPIKLMPLLAETIEAFWALVSELPGLLCEYGHKLYTHTVPTGIEVETFQQHGWQIEAMMPESYKPGVVTQQWGLTLEGNIMKTMRVKHQYFASIMAETKPLEVRVGYENIKRIKVGDRIQLESNRETGVVEVTGIRVYSTFEQMLKKENPGHIVPENSADALKVLQRIYPLEKESLGVYVFSLKVIGHPAS